MMERGNQMSNRIYIIGMGPGRRMMTGEAIAALEQADVIVGYTVYVKLLGDVCREKTADHPYAAGDRTLRTVVLGRRKPGSGWH